MNVDIFVKANNLQQITNPILLNKGYIPSPDGLLSVEIFGSTMAKRKNTFAYIDLNGHFLQPLAYNTLKKIFSKLDTLISGQTYWSVTKDGELVEDENGNTGIEFLYNNWNKIKWKRNESKLRNEKITFLELYKRDEVFMSKQIVCPPFFRDINLQNKDAKKPSVHQINGPYSKLIRLASMLDQGNFALSLHGTRLNIQKEIENIYSYFKGRTEKKNGLIRQAVLGKSDDYCSRVVIAAPQFKQNAVDDMMIDFYHAGLPLSHTISTFTPFFVGWVQNRLVEELSSNEYKTSYRDPKTGNVRYREIKDPRLQFTDEVILKMMNKYIYNYTNRFDPIEIEFTDGTKGKILFRGIDPATGNRHHEYMTLTDLFYLAAHEITADKHVYITRYPIADHLGIFPNRIRVLSTNTTMKMVIDGTTYTHYPVINPDASPDEISISFIEVLQMSNVYLKALGGDYDGDQVTVKSVFSQEANIEAEKKMRSVSNILSVNGNNIRTSSIEAVLTLFSMSRW